MRALKFYGLVLVIVSLIHGMGWAFQLTPQEKTADFRYLLHQIEAGYGPLNYKIQQDIADFDQLSQSYLERVAQSFSNAHYYYLVQKFIAEFEDGHFGARIPTDYVLSLPISTDLIDGKVIVTHVNEGELSESGLQVGDRIVEFNGRPVGEELDWIQQFVGSGFELTERRISTWLLFRRPATALPVPQDSDVSFKFQSRKDASIQSVELQWDEEGDYLDENDSFGAEKGDSQRLLRLFSQNVELFQAERQLLPQTDYSQLSHLSALKTLFGSTLDRKFACSGDTRIELPEDAEIIFEKPFVAYTYPSEEGRLGYLRIPHYMPSPQQGDGFSPPMEARFEQYRYAVDQLEKKTVGLVIDQDHNCGGSVRYLERMLSLFINEPFEAVSFRFLATKLSFLDFRQWLDFIPENTFGRSQMEETVDLIEESWRSGDDMTPHTSFRGDALVFPNRVQYTKPIVVLIDEIAGSGGDAFPAMIQGHGGATLLGQRTSGLGGHIGSLPPLPFSGINVYLTKSLFFRPDGVAVENNGAVPDIEYTHSVSDSLNGFVKYREFYTQALLKKIKSSQSSNQL